MLYFSCFCLFCPALKWGTSCFGGQPETSCTLHPATLFPFSSMPYRGCVWHPTNPYVIYSSFQGIPGAVLEVHAELCFSIAEKVLNLIQHEKNSMFAPKEANSAVGIWQSESLSSIYIWSWAFEITYFCQNRTFDIQFTGVSNKSYIEISRAEPSRWHQIL